MELFNVMQLMACLPITIHLDLISLLLWKMDKILLSCQDRMKRINIHVELTMQ